MKLRSTLSLSICSGAALIAFSHCVPKHESKKVEVQPKKEQTAEKTEEQKGETEESSSDKDVVVEPTPFSSPCALIATDSSILTSSLKDICVKSNNGAQQLKVSMLVSLKKEGVEPASFVIKGGDATNDGLTRDVSKLLAVKSQAELKQLICSTHKQVTTADGTITNDLFDVFYVKYVNDDATQGWAGEVGASGEIAATTVDADICAKYDTVAVEKVILP